MGQVIIRNLDERTLAALKMRAAANGRSLEQELRLLLGRAARPTRHEVRESAAAIRALRQEPVSVDLDDLIRDDRER